MSWNPHLYTTDTGHIPSSWLEGTIIPIYKYKGNPSDPSSYRPITILSCLGKLFTSVLNRRLNIYLENNNILNENKAGLKKQYPTSDHLFTLYALIDILRKKRAKALLSFH